MVEENVILVNENDEPIGLMPKLEAHEKALLHRHSAAERNGGAALGARSEQHLAGHPDPAEADAGLRDALDAGDRSRGHRHAGGG